MLTIYFNPHIHKWDIKAYILKQQTKRFTDKCKCDYTYIHGMIKKNLFLVKSNDREKMMDKEFFDSLQLLNPNKHSIFGVYIR